MTCTLNPTCLFCQGEHYFPTALYQHNISTIQAFYWALHISALLVICSVDWSSATLYPQHRKCPALQNLHLAEGRRGRKESYAMSDLSRAQRSHVSHGAMCEIFGEFVGIRFISSTSLKYWRKAETNLGDANFLH